MGQVAGFDIEGNGRLDFAKYGAVRDSRRPREWAIFVSGKRLAYFEKYRCSVT